MAEPLPARLTRAMAEIAGIASALPADAAEPLVAEILAAKRIALHGLGREGLQMRGLAMRLFHLGLDAHVVGEMTTPPIGAGDLLFVAAGPGDFASIAALMQRARSAGARTAVVTAEPDGGAARRSDAVLVIPAQTMASDAASPTSVLPMGSLFEATLMLVFEVLVLELRDRLGETAETMRARHTNME